MKKSMIVLLLAMLVIPLVTSAQQTIATPLYGATGLPSLANDGVTGTGNDLLACLTSATPSAAITCTAAVTGGIIGICAGNCGTSTPNPIIAGHPGEYVSCVFDGSTTAKDFVTISPTVNGNCHDSGSATTPPSPNLGRVTTTNGSGGTYWMIYRGSVDTSTTSAPNMTTGWTVTGATSGGGIYFDSTTDAKSTGLLAQYDFMLGGGAGNPYATTPNLSMATAGALQVGVPGTTLGTLTLAGSSGSTSVIMTPNAGATTVTMGGQFTSFLVPVGTVSAVNMGTALNTGLYLSGVGGFGFSDAGASNFFAGASVVEASGNVSFHSLTITGNNVFSGGSDGSTTQGSGTFRGGNVSTGSTTAQTAGATTVQGGDNLATGATETAGGLTIRTGHTTAAGTTNNQGTLAILQSFTKQVGGPNTAGLLEYVGSSDLTVTDGSGTTALALVGIAAVVTGNAVDVQTYGIATNGTSSTSVAFTRGDFACEDTTNGIQYVKDNGTTPCPIGTAVGVVQKSETSSGAHWILIQK